MLFVPILYLVSEIASPFGVSSRSSPPDFLMRFSMIVSVLGVSYPFSGFAE